MCVVLKMIMRTNGKTPKFDDLIHQYLIIVSICMKFTLLAYKQPMCGTEFDIINLYNSL